MNRPAAARARPPAGVVAGIFAAVALSTVAHGQQLSSVQNGAAAPDFTALGSDGRQHKLSGYRGSTVVLEWTSPICEVTAQFYGSGMIQALQKGAAAHKVVWLAINTAGPSKAGYLTADAANRLTKTRGATINAFLFDPTAAVGRQYGAKATPSVYIVNAKGTLVYQGAVAASPGKGPNYVQAALDEVGAGKPVSTPMTPQRGCPVEY